MWAFANLVKQIVVNIMKREKQKKREQVAFNTVLVRENRNPDILVEMIYKKVGESKSNPIKEFKIPYIEGRISDIIATHRINKFIRAQVKTTHPKVIIDFGGMSPDKQYAIAGVLKKKQNLKPLEKYIEIKDGPFSYSAERLRAEIFGE